MMVEALPVGVVARRADRVRTVDGGVQLVDDCLVDDRLKLAGKEGGAVRLYRRNTNTRRMVQFNSEFQI